MDIDYKQTQRAISEVIERDCKRTLGYIEQSSGHIASLALACEEERDTWQQKKMAFMAALGIKESCRVLMDTIEQSRRLSEMHADGQKIVVPGMQS